MPDQLTTPDLPPSTDPAAETTAPGGEDYSKRRNKSLMAGIQACKTYRRKLSANWRVNIDFRRGKPYASQTDEDRIVVPMDWPLTKSKEASLFSQVPRIVISHPPQTTSPDLPWLSPFEQKINDAMKTGGIEAVMEQCLPDCINAAGFGVVLVSYESIEGIKQVPAVDLSTLPPEVAAQAQATGQLPDGSPLMVDVPYPIDSRYLLNRVSPADFLWPINTVVSDFNQCPWLGRSGRLNWVRAQKLFNLDPQEKQRVCGDSRTYLDKLTHDTDRDKYDENDVVSFDEIFVKEFEYDPEAKSYSAIRRLVFIPGKEEPVVDEPWTGQRITESGVLGSNKTPIQVLTLTYLTDDSIPPSDSAIGRSQVEEINKTRTQYILQRQRSLPISWFNVDRIDPAVQQTLMRGVWQGMIPVQGNGDSSIGQVARAAFPPENTMIDNVAKADLDLFWQVGPNQQGGFAASAPSASESKIVQSNFSTRVAKERAKVAKFVCNIAEVLGGLISVFEDPASIGEGFDPSISKALAYSIVPDSAVIQDTATRRETLKDFINFTAKSGFIDIEPVLREYATLSGLDPNVVVKAPGPKPPVEPSISLRLTGVEDLMNPLTLAFLKKTGQAPEPELIEQAKRDIQQAMMPPAAGPPIPGPNGPGSGPQGPAEGPINIDMNGAPLPGQETLPPNPPGPSRPPEGVGSAHADWSAMSRINSRVLDRS